MPEPTHAQRVKAGPEPITVRPYDNAFVEIFARVVRSIQADDPVFGQIETQTSEHCGPIRNVRGENPLDQRPFQASVSFEFAHEVVRSTDVPHLRKLIIDSAVKATQEGHRAFFSRMGEVLEHSGQTVKGAPNWDTFIACLERVQVDFESDGSPQMPQIVAGPKAFHALRSTPPTAEQEARIKSVLQRKREEFRARRRTRRLS